MAASHGSRSGSSSVTDTHQRTGSESPLMKAHVERLWRQEASGRLAAVCFGGAAVVSGCAVATLRFLQGPVDDWPQVVALGVSGSWLAPVAAAVMARAMLRYADKRGEQAQTLVLEAARQRVEVEQERSEPATALPQVPPSLPAHQPQGIVPAMAPAPATADTTVEDKAPDGWGATIKAWGTEILTAAINAKKDG